MSKGKFKYKKIVFAFLLVSLMLFTFALPCSAEQRILYQTADLDLTANYVIESGLDLGSRDLVYEGLTRLGSLAWYSYGNAPFNITSGQPDGYSMSVLINGINPSLTSSSNVWNIATRIAIGNGTSIFNMPDSLEVRLLSSNGVWVKNLAYEEKGNVAYINDNINITSNGTYSIELFFGFGEMYSSNPLDVWSNATHLYLYRLQFSRADDINDVGQNITDSITDNTNNIINSTTDKNNQANTNAENELNQITSEEDDLVNQMDNIFNQLPDISLFENEVLGVATTGNIMLAVFNGFGDKFIHLWWILSTIGILATFIGLLIKRKKD